MAVISKPIHVTLFHYEGESYRDQLNNLDNVQNLVAHYKSEEISLTRVPIANEYIDINPSSETVYLVLIVIHTLKNDENSSYANIYCRKVDRKEAVPNLISGRV